MVRLGLCCLFAREPITFRSVTAKSLYGLTRKEQLRKLSGICLHNAHSLLAAVKTVHRLGIGAFRISSQFLPRYTHPDIGYHLEDLPDAVEIVAIFKQVNRLRRSDDIRLSFHPDQFVVLSSPHEDVVKRSLAEIEYQTILAKAMGADAINIHVGGAYGDKTQSLNRFARSFERLSMAAQERLTVENDDVTYTVSDILPFCNALKIPLVYDVHHHRCNPDSLSEEEATQRSLETWNRQGREPLFHISSPKNGWNSPKPRPHADYLDPADIPNAWRSLSGFTLDVEAKAKELAVLKLKNEWPFN